MILEHLIYSTSFAIIVGMVYYKYTARDPSWIIIASAYVPDFGVIIVKIAEFNNICLHYLHEYLHSITMLFIFAFFTALLLQVVGIKFKDSFLFACLGYGAHLFEDALVLNPGYSFFWPIYTKRLSIGIIEVDPMNLNWFGFANSVVLFLGLILLMSTAIIRTLYEGNGWIKRMIPIFQ